MRDLVLFNTAAVVSIRWLATAAHIGPGSLALWAGAAIFFFVPLALAVSHLTSRFPEQGGLYVWTRHSFGAWHGFLCGWCYWVSNLFYFPSLLITGTGIALYMRGVERAAQAEDRVLVVALSLAILWAALLTNLVGMRVGKWTQNLGATATYVAGAGLILTGALALVRHGSVTHFSLAPEWSWSTLNYWPQIAFAFGGLELAAIMSGEIRDPARTVRRAAWISAVAIAGFYIAGTAAILILLQPADVSVVTGLAQAGEAASARLRAAWITPVMSGLVALGVAGQFGAWVGGGARLASVIGVDRYLPASFSKLHPRWRTPHVALLAQGVACTVFLAAMQLGENLRTGFQLLVDMTVISYFVPFLYLFATAWKHGLHWSSAAGAIVTAAGIAFSFVPPEGASSVWLYEAKLVLGCAVLAAAASYFFTRAARTSHDGAPPPP